MFAFDRATMPRAAAMAVIVALAMGATLAVAQQAPAREGPSAHARHAAKGDPLMGVLWHLKSSLNLNTSQQAQWDAAVAQGKNAREQGKALRQGVKSALDTELAKDQPDLAAVAGAADTARAQGQQLRTTVRNAWLAVYDGLAPDQKALVRDALRSRVTQMEQMRAAHNRS